MTRPIAVLRPEPGNSATADRIAKAGFIALRVPIFTISAGPWAPPPATDFDALLLTSANAVRQAGPALHTFSSLPLVTVGRGTADAAEAAGLTPQIVGSSDGREALALAKGRGWHRLVRLTGRAHIHLPGVTEIVVYTSDPLHPAEDQLRALADSIVLLHSPRAARHFAGLIAGAHIARRSIRLAALSQAVADAAGGGWQRVSVAPLPSDPALLETAMTLAIDR
jgi:uroporphyrinogen-III synthase